LVHRNIGVAVGGIKGWGENGKWQMVKEARNREHEVGGAKD